MSRDVFISHSSRDEAAKRVCRLLEESGITCWMAPRDIPSGQPWAATIIQAVRACKVMLVLVSSSSIESEGVARELAVADAEHVPLIFVRLENVKLDKDIEFFGAASQWVDASSGPLETHAREIIDNVAAVLHLPRVERPSGLRLWLRANWGIVCAGTVILGAIMVWVAMPKPCGSDYRVHLALLDDQGTRVDAAEIRSNSTGAVTKRVGGWEIRVPRRHQPPGGKLTINASSMDGLLTGETELRLSSACEPAVSVQLTRAPETTVSGTVTDSAGRLVEGARVSVDGHENEAVTTGTDGAFSLPAHEPAGTLVVLRVQKDGFHPVAERRYAGPDRATILIER